MYPFICHYSPDYKLACTHSASVLHRDITNIKTCYNNVKIHRKTFSCSSSGSSKITIHWKEAKQCTQTNSTQIIGLKKCSACWWDIVLLITSSLFSYITPAHVLQHFHTQKLDARCRLMKTMSTLFAALTPDCHGLTLVVSLHAKSYMSYTKENSNVGSMGSEWDKNSVSVWKMVLKK